MIDKINHKANPCAGIAVRAVTTGRMKGTRVGAALVAVERG